ncbi:hypothetical protein [Methanoculleus sp. 10]|uniref:DUF7839 domain-containing protein n=1 Tax=Methanoculleus sp. 10 TaxID=430615 RepID=UPI003418694F
MTKNGIEWVLRHAEALEAYARHINRDIIQQVAVWTAVAREDIRKGDTVGVLMQDGWLYATKQAQSATGRATMDAKPGRTSASPRLSGIIEHEEGSSTSAKVPRVEQGGSRHVRTDLLRDAVRDAEMVAAVGLEPYVALRKADIEAGYVLRIP